MPIVLVAEDDAAIRKLICAVVRKQGVDVVSASDGEEAILRTQEGAFDALLLDLMMPNQSGWAVMEQLAVAQSPLLSKTVVITAASDREIGHLPDQTRILRKPFDLRELVRTLRETVGMPADDNAPLGAHPR
jgi:two-component system, OmpR family, response regulator